MRRGGGGGGRRGGSPRSQNFDSSGPDIKVRGTAQQVVDKYQALAREAATAGDPVMAENYYQHAEHYYRILHANGGGDNRQGGRPQEGDRFNDNDRIRDESESGDMQPGGEFAAEDEEDVVEAAPDAPAAPPAAAEEQPVESRRNGHGRRRSRSAPRDDAPRADGAEPVTQSPAMATSEETGEPAA